VQQQDENTFLILSGDHGSDYMFCFIFSSFIDFYVCVVCLFFIVLEMGNLQASIKDYFNYFLIMKEVGEFFKKIDRMIVIYSRLQYIILFAGGYVFSYENFLNLFFL
jgi:hypothetical protein